LIVETTPDPIATDNGQRRPRPLSRSETAARLRAIGLYCLALLLLAGVDTTAKYSSRFVPVMEVAFFRYAGAAIVAILALRPWRRPELYLTRRPALQIARSLLLTLSTVFNFGALRFLQLAETTTISFAGAFLVAALAGPMLGEWIGPRRWAAIAVGFVGVVIVTRPGPEGIRPAVLLALGTMISNSLYLILTRRLAPTDSAEGMLLFPAVAATLVLAPVALPAAVWPPSVLVGMLLFATGFLGAVGHWFLIGAHRQAPAASLAPFVYFQLIWMTGLGYLVFGDLPHRITLIGAAVIIASGLYILYRQRVHGDH
jgi:drug/metabolite transporter (DMT)-like permease